MHPFLVSTAWVALAEFVDRTQIATVALAARFGDRLPVVAGTTLGMWLASDPAVLFGRRYADRLPSRWIHALAATLFIVLGGLARRTALPGQRRAPRPAAADFGACRC